MMDGWTEFDLVRIENQLKEARLRRTAMMPKLAPHRPIRSALASALVTLARHLADEPITARPRENLVGYGAET